MPQQISIYRVNVQTVQPDPKVNHPRRRGRGRWAVCRGGLVAAGEGVVTELPGGPFPGSDE